MMEIGWIFPFGTEDKQTVNNLIMTSELVFAERASVLGAVHDHF